MGGSSDRIWLFLIFLFVIAMGVLIFLSSVKREQEIYRQSKYFIDLNNIMFGVQDETIREVGMQAAVLVTFREKALKSNGTEK